MKPIITILILVCTLFAIGQKEYTIIKKLEDTKINAKVEAILSKMTLEEKVSMCHANGKFTVNAIPHLGIKEMWLSDGPHGVREEISKDSWAVAGWDNDHATYLPTLTALAATFNPKMAELHGSVLGAEARHRKKDIILGPGINLARNPLCGRNFEYMGEDPYLISQMVVPEIIAIQKNDVAACLKHYVLNSQELNRTTVNAIPDERTLRELYLPPFKAAVTKGEVYSVMGAYNEFRGTSCSQSNYLVNTILKKEWGFKGIMMTDWNCSINTKEAALNGLDLEMGTNKESYDDYYLANPFLQMIKSGEISEAVLDDKVRRILRVQLTIGMMSSERKSGKRNEKEHQEAAQKIIEEGCVLLKNNGVLPLNKKDVKTVLVIGPNANRKHGHSGGSSKIKSLYEVTPLDGLKNQMGNNVKIEHLIVESSEHAYPIWDEYVSSQEPGPGVPCWKFLFKGENRKTLAYLWEAEPVFSSRNFENLSDAKKSALQFTNLKIEGKVKPPVTGEYQLMVKANNAYKLYVNKKEVFFTEETKNDFEAVKCDLKANEEYIIELESYGTGDVELGWVIPGRNSKEEDYLKKVEKADAVLYFGGLNHGYDREGRDRKNMILPNNQNGVISKLIKANPNTVIFIIGGSPVEMPWAKNANAIVWGWYGGMEAGNAYARILFGDVNPSGKMPFTLPKNLEDSPHAVLQDYNGDECEYKEGVFIGYRWFQAKKKEVNYPFGHGLSYTNFEYKNVYVEFDKNAGIVKCKVTVSNSGKVKGKETVQLYVHDVICSVPRPVKELKGFNKVELAPGEEKTIEFEVNKKDLSFWSTSKNDWFFEAGKFEFMVGSSCEDIREVVQLVL